MTNFIRIYFIFHFRYCLFGLNVGLTEKFESNSQPMKIHVSEPCKQLLSAQYKCEQRDDPELREKVGGHTSHFLISKDGRQPLRPEVIKALLPTASEMPSVGGEKKEEKKVDTKEEKKDDPSKKEEEKKTDALKADEPAPKTNAPATKAEANKADELSPPSAPAPGAAPTEKSPEPETVTAPEAEDSSAPAEENPEAEEAAPATESAPGEVCYNYILLCNLNYNLGN